jgi:uncharacterized protein (TIGR03067 family)
VRATKILPAVLLLFAGTAVADDDERLDGKWVVESMTRDGKPDDTWTGATREHAGPKYSMSKEGGKSVSGTMRVDTVKKTIDLMPNEGQYKGKALKGVYGFSGDNGTLTIAFAEPDRDRPADLKGGPGVTVVVYKRKK